MSWITTIEQVGKDVEIGLQAAGAVLEEAPATAPLGVILTEVANVIGAIEAAVQGGAKSPNPTAVSSAVQAATLTSALKAVGK